MIRKSDKLLLWEIKCDSCHVIIAECMGFEWNDGQELVYSLILCEKCGTERNRDQGTKTQRVEKLEKELAKLKENLK